MNNLTLYDYCEFCDTKMTQEEYDYCDICSVCRAEYGNGIWKN